MLPKPRGVPNSGDVDRIPLEPKGLLISSIVDSLNYMHMVGLMQRLKLISLDDGVVFPGMPITLSFDPGSDKHVLLVPRHAGRYAKVGVVAEVTERVQLPG